MNGGSNNVSISVENKEIINENDISKSQVDMSMVVKSSSNKYSREDFMRLKKKMKSLSPDRIPSTSML